MSEREVTKSNINRWVSPGDALAGCQRWLAENPDAPLTERVAMATVVCCCGDVARNVTLEEIGELIDETPYDVLTGLLALADAAGVADGC